jgi:hypothetical protein
MRSQGKGTQDAADRRLTQATCLGHIACKPMRSCFRLVLQGSCQHPFYLLVTQLAWSAGRGSSSNQGPHPNSAGAICPPVCSVAETAFAISVLFRPSTPSNIMRARMANAWAALGRLLHDNSCACSFRPIHTALRHGPSASDLLPLYPMDRSLSYSIVQTQILIPKRASRTSFRENMVTSVSCRLWSYASLS